VTLRSDYPGLSMENGLLKFDNVNAFYTIMNQLSQQSKDSTTVNSAYLTLGFTPEIMDDDTTSIPAFPVLDLFEQSIGFVSARQQEQIDQFELLRSGADIEYLQDHFIADVFLKTLLNVHNEVKIGSRIYKFYPNGFTAVITNSDYSALETLQTSYGDDIPLDSMRDRHNLRFIQENPDYYFNLNSSFMPVSHREIMDTRFKYVIKPGNIISLENISAIDDGIDDGNISYSWTIEEKSLGTSITYSGVNPPDYNFSTDAVLITLIATEPDGDKDTSSLELFPLRCLYETTFDHKCGDPTFTFNLWEPKEDGVNIGLQVGRTDRCMWTTTIYWGDGTSTKLSGWGLPNTVFPSHTYSKDGNYLISYYVHWDCWPDGGLSCIANLHVNIRDINGATNCKTGQNRGHSDIVTGHISRNRTRLFKIKGKIWAFKWTFATTKVGSSTRSYRKKYSWQIWSQKKVKQIEAHLEGIWYEKLKRKDCPCAPNNIPPKWDVETNSSYVARNISGTHNASARFHSMKSSHRAIVGTRMGEICNIPELFLL